MPNKLSDEIKKTLSLSLPISGMLIAQKTLQLINAFMMGLLGASALAAGAIATSIYTAFLIIGIGILNIVGIFIAQSFGANNKTMVNVHLHHGFYLAAILSMPLLFLIWCIPFFLTFFSIDPTVIELSSQYLRATMWGFPALLIFATLREFVSALHVPLIITFTSCFAIPLNFLLSYWFLYGTFFISPLGVTGIGYANAITEWSMAFFLMLYVINNRYLAPYAAFSKWTPLRFSILGDFLRIGISGSLTAFLETLMSVTLVFLMGYFGVAALAAHQIAFQLINFLFMFPLGISLSMGLRISHLLGTGDLSRAYSTVCSGLCIGLIYSLAVILVLIFFASNIVGLFIHPDELYFAEVSSFACSFLMIGTLFQCFDTMQVILIGTLRGYKDTFIPMLIVLFSYLVLALGGGYLLAFKFNLEGKGIWWGLVIGFLTSAMLLFLRLVRKMNNVLEAEQAPQTLLG